MDKTILSDESLVELGKNGDSEAINILSERHSGVFHTYANKFIYATSGTLSQDIRDNQKFTIWEAVRTFDNKKDVKFPTWLGQITRYQCCAVIDQFNLGKSDKEVSLEKLMENELNPDYFNSPELIQEENQKIKNSESVALIEDVLSQLKDEKIKLAVEERFLKGKVKSYQKTGETLGVSGQSIKNRENIFINLARNKLQSETLCDII